MKHLILAVMLLSTLPALAQNVGIGTLTPAYKLHVAGGDLFFSTATGSARIGIQGGNQWVYSTAGSGADLIMYSFNGTTASQRLIFKQNGSVGIGTPTGTAGVDARLTIQGAGTTSITNALLIKNASSDSLMQLLDNGNIGFSIAPSSATYRLSVNQDGTATRAIGLFSNNNFSGMIGVTDTTMEIAPRSGLLIGSTSAIDLILIPPAGIASVGGNVGIGINNPTARLMIASTGNTYASNALMITNSNGDTLLRLNNAGNLGVGYNPSNNLARLNIGQDADATLGISFYKGSNLAGVINATDSTLEIQSKTGGFLGASTDLVLLPPQFLGTQGNLGIGVNKPNAKLHVAGAVIIGSTTSVTANGYKLSVEGMGMFEELKVQLHANWPDYVFSDQYALMPLAELEKQIQQTGHLPNIPSAHEVLQTKGIQLGEMNRLLLEKIEELTLYQIEAHKQIEQLRARIAQLEQL